jgi:hypothetical protein
MTSYLNLLKINDRSPFDTSFEGDVNISDDLRVKDDITGDLITCEKLVSNGEVEGNSCKVNQFECTEIAKSNIIDGDNYILLKASGLDTINKRNQFLRFRTGGNPTSFSGLCFSSFDSAHLRCYQSGTNFYMGSSSQVSSTPTNASFTDNIMNISAHTGNINIGSIVSQASTKLTVTGGTENLRIQSYGSDIPTIGFYRANGSESAPLTLSNGQTVGRIGFYARDASSYNFCASMNVLIDGEINTASDPSDIPTRISFFTTLDGQNSLSERMTIKNDGGIGIGVSTPSTTALLDLTSTTRGFLPPRLTTVQKNAIVSPAFGLVVYDTTLNNLCVYNGAWIELVESFSRSFIKLSRTSGQTSQGAIFWNTNLKNGTDFNYTNNASTFSVNATGYYEIIANLSFNCPTDQENLLEVLFDRVTPTAANLSIVRSGCSYFSTTTYVEVTMHDIVQLNSGETYQFTYNSSADASVDFSSASRAIIKRII